MSDIELDYDSLMQDALKRVVHDVLKITAELGETPGEHHFYIEFMTGAEGVSIPDHLHDVYPTRMTIVLHHQFENLTVTDTGFGVTLWFKGVETRLEIPFDAMTSFADPGAKFGLRFHEEDGEDVLPITQDGQDNQTQDKDSQNADSVSKLTDSDDTEKKPDGDESNNNHDSSTDDGSADVVSLDAFRRK